MTSPYAREPHREGTKHGGGGKKEKAAIKLLLKGEMKGAGDEGAEVQCGEGRSKKVEVNFLQGRRKTDRLMAIYILPFMIPCG